MTAVQGVFLADGPSDLPLAVHLERICANLGTSIALTPINPHLLPRGVGRTVSGRLAYILRERIRIDIAFVHRDAEAQDPQLRFAEIADGANTAGVECPVVPVVPVRMTEAWLLLDEAEIRRVAGRPRGRTPLGLPPAHSVANVADPKTALREALLTASEETGRRRQRVARAFDRNRALLLERLDVNGPIASLAAWQRLLADTTDALARLD